MRTNVMKFLPGLNARQLVYFWCHRVLDDGRCVIVSSSCQHPAPISQDAEDAVGTIERAKHYFLAYIIEPIPRYRADESCTRLTSYVQLDLGAWVPEMVENKVCIDLALMLDVLVSDLCGNNEDERLKLEHHANERSDSSWSIFAWLKKAVIGDERPPLCEGDWWGDVYELYIEPEEEKRVSLVQRKTEVVAEKDKQRHHDWRPQSKKKAGLLILAEEEDEPVTKLPTQHWTEKLGMDVAAMSSGVRGTLTTETKRRASKILEASTETGSVSNPEWKGAGRRASEQLRRDKMEKEMEYKMKMQDPEKGPIRRKASMTMPFTDVPGVPPPPNNTPAESEAEGDKPSTVAFV
jgi:hypothetical protein